MCDRKIVVLCCVFARVWVVGLVVVVLLTLCSRVRHWDRLFDSSPIKGEGDDGCFGLVHPCHPVDTALKPV